MAILGMADYKVPERSVKREIREIIMGKNSDCVGVFSEYFSATDFRNFSQPGHWNLSGA